MKKILFNDKAGLTKAVLNGSKTVTRRCVKGDVVGQSPYSVGEIIAIAQAYRDIFNDPYHIGLYGRSAGWSNKMFVKSEIMPHHIKIVNIRAEYLQDISDDDCIKEGVKLSEYVKSPREAFAALIDKVSGRGTWESNPLVFVYDFELVD